MGREIRRVPADWTGKDIGPHYDQSFREAAAEWKEGYRRWEAGERWSYRDNAWVKRDENDNEEYWEYDSPPDRDYYRPHWEDEERTHYMMYESTSEGTPISPAFATPEELARWLADTGASSFASLTATYEQWLYICKGGWAPSAVISPGSGIVSGVEFVNGADVVWPTIN